MRGARRHIVFPLACALLAALLMLVIGTVNGVTGFRGGNESSGVPLLLTQALTDALPLAGLIFVVTFVVVAIWVQVRP
jgi:hypothetical protein